MSPQPVPEAQRFLLIRVAMAVGVATFFVVAWFISRSATAPAFANAKVRTLSTVMYVAVGLAAAAIMALRLRIAEAAPAMRRSLSVVAWAVGEFAAIFGGVMLFVTGDWRLALPGALVFAMSLAVVRMPE